VSDRLEDVVRAVGPPVSVSAMSFGGPVGLARAYLEPEWVSSLVLFGTFANGPAAFADARMAAMVVEIARTHWGVGSKMLADLYRPGPGDEAAWHLARVFRDSASGVGRLPGAHVPAGRELAAALDPDPGLGAALPPRPADPVPGRAELPAGLPNTTFLPLVGRVHLPDAADLDTIEQAIVVHVRHHDRGR
jgi:pimeloyl-ACP methyl ester carboxylesterase